MNYTTDELFGIGVRERREDLGWSMTELARRLQEKGLENFHATTIGRLERGERPVRLSEAQAIVDVFKEQFGGESLNDFLFEPSSGAESIEIELKTIDEFAEAAGFNLHVHHRVRRDLRAEIMKAEERLENGEIRDEHIDVVKDAIQRGKEYLESDRVKFWKEKIDGMTSEEYSEYSRKHR